MKPKEYQVGGKDSIGNTVRLILAKSDKAVVYMTEETPAAPNGQLRWELDDGGVFPEPLRPAVAHFDRLLARIKTCDCRPKLKETAYELLGKGFFLLLDSGEPQVEEEAFQGIEAFLAKHDPQSLAGRVKNGASRLLGRMNWFARAAAVVAVLLIGCSICAWVDAWMAARQVPQSRLVVEKPGAAELIVLVHGYKGGSNSMSEVIAAVAKKRPDADILLFTYPTRTFGNTNPFRLAERLEESIHTIQSARRYRQIHLCGHSMGALLVRKAYVYGCGQLDDAPSVSTEAEMRRAVREWTTKVDRIVLLAGMNRGWSVEYSPAEMGLLRRAAIHVGMFVARISRTGQCIRSFERGEPFVANLRLQWLAAMAIAKAGDGGLRPPTVIQLLGDKDDLVNPEDSRDVAVARDFLWLPVNDTGHATILQLSDATAGREREEKIQRAFGTDADINALRADQMLPDNQVDTNVTTVVFVLHGIRDWGDWTTQFKAPLEQEYAAMYPEEGARGIHVHPPGYGWFPMGAFLLWADRQKNVRWFMDQVTELHARFPNLKRIHFIGHSNGTYILASALEKYRTLKVGRVVFAGSVVPTDFPWSKLQATRRVQKVRNFVGSGDWVVGLFPNLFELPFFKAINPDLGSAGYNGFRDPLVKSYQVEFVKGAHSAALVPENVKSIVEFIVRDQATSVKELTVAKRTGVDSVLNVFARICWLVWLSLVVGIIYAGWRLPRWLSKIPPGRPPRPATPLLVWGSRTAYALIVWLVLNTI